MVTVLRGHSLAKLRKFIENNGTRHPFVFGNAPATTLWFEELRLSSKGPESDNEPLTWIKDLTQPDPLRRPQPWALADQIRHSASSTAFIGICCANDDEGSECPSPPLITNPEYDENEVPLLEQLEAFGSIEKPFGSLIQPSKQSSVEQWLGIDPVTTVAIRPQPSALLGAGIVGAPYEVVEDESVEQSTGSLTYQDAVIQNPRQEKVLETCIGYEITEDHSDDGRTERTGYEVTEDSSGSEPTIRCPSSSSPTEYLETPASECHETSPSDFMSVTAIVRELDSVSEIPKPTESKTFEVPLRTSTLTDASDAPITRDCSSTRIPTTNGLNPLPSTVEPTGPQIRSPADHATLTKENLHMVSGPIRDFVPPQLPIVQRTMTAEFYMQEVWDAASTIETSVLSMRTQKDLSRLGPGIVWQDRNMNYVTHYAKVGKAAAVRELLKAGCNPGTLKKPNYRPLICAVRAGSQRHNKVVKALLDHGANVNAVHPGSGKTALHFAIENPYFPGYTNLIRNLLEHAANPNALDKNKDTPLLQILYGGYKPLEKHKRDALACLLQPHLDVDVNVMPPGTLNMPIHLAVRRHDAIAVAMLIHKGSMVNEPNGAGATPLRIAASTWKENISDNDVELLRYLLEGGAEVDDTIGSDSNTVLHLAASQGCTQAVKLLVRHKANRSLRNSDCKSALELATANQSKMSQATYAAIQQELQ